MTPLPDVVALPLREVLDDDGRLTPGERSAQNVHALLDELRRCSEALGRLRKPA